MVSGESEGDLMVSARAIAWLVTIACDVNAFEQLPELLAIEEELQNDESGEVRGEAADVVDWGNGGDID